MARTSDRKRKAHKAPVEAELRLQDWGPKGSAAADQEGKRVLVDRGIPGELVEAVISRGRGPGRGVVRDVIEPSPERVAPPCPYYLLDCGGCQWQHLSYAAQLETKRLLVDREMVSAGVEARVIDVHAMQEPWHYRHTAAIAIGWEAGFRPRGRRGILEIHDCLISHPLIGALAAALNDLLRAGSLPNYHGKVWLNCTVVGSPAAPALQVLLQGIEGLTLETHPELSGVAETIASLPHVQSVAYRHRSGEPCPLVGDVTATIEVGGRPMYLPAGSFFQTNLIMLPRVLSRLRSVLQGRRIRQSADIYGGVGALGLPLASQVEGMILVELDPLAVRAAEQTADAWGLHNVSFVSRHAERALPDLLPLDLAIVDPPRSGLGEIVVGAIADKEIPLLLYLSCSPPSLARDLAALAARDYQVCSLEIFDFYPQTYHVESLAVLER
jgi:23S rRNA (uracil1939-C5)-methyltransferase